MCCKSAHLIETLSVIQLDNRLYVCLLTAGPASPFCPIGPANRENCVGGTSQLWKPSVAGGVTELYEGLVGRGVTGALVVLGCLVGLTTCLEPGLEVLAVVVLDIVDFEGVTLGTLDLEGATLMELVLGLVGVALEGVVFGLGDVFFAVVGCGFLGRTPCSEAESSFILVGLLLLVAGTEDFFLLSVTVANFLGMLARVGFAWVGLEVF